MESKTKPGVVIFASEPSRLARFYAAVTGMAIVLADEGLIVMESGAFQLLIHALAGEPVPEGPAAAREDSYIKPFFPVASLAETRERAATLGGVLRPASQEWEARGFRACEGVDPEGNVIQFRQDLG